MRKRLTQISMDYKILVLDDEEGIINSIKVMLNRNGYYCVGVTNPLEAIEVLKNQTFDMLILDYIMTPINGDQVVSKLRQFNKDIYILMLTGHKDLAPPLDTIKALDIQGYCEKSNRFDQLMLLIESGIKSISQMRTIRQFKDGLNKILQTVPKIYQLQPISTIMEEILKGLMPLVNSDSAFILIDDFNNTREKKVIFKGVGRYDIPTQDLVNKLSPYLMEQIGKSRGINEVLTLGSGIIFPLYNEYNTSMGVIYIESKNFKEGKALIEIYARQAASSINNAFLHSLINMKKEELDKTYKELKKRYLDTI
ncbi:MAG TPA: DUF3369 domain-containing protein, partial [Clostridium sp.]|nr:DUF3369 domain-containing protein [Clostridium sp.]